MARTAAIGRVEMTRTTAIGRVELSGEGGIAGGLIKSAVGVRRNRPPATESPSRLGWDDWFCWLNQLPVTEPRVNLQSKCLETFQKALKDSKSLHANISNIMQESNIVTG